MSGGNSVNPRHRRGRRGPADPDKEPFLKQINSLSEVSCLEPLNTPRRRVLPADDDRRRSVSAGRYNRLPRAEPKSSSKKEKGIWNWNPIRALSHFGHRRFDCRFSFHVHDIQGLPPDLEGASFAVRWRRISEPAASAQSTLSTLAVQGAAEFKETLYYSCSVYGARSGLAGSAKYEPRQFVISTTAEGAAKEVQLGRHVVDFALLLPQDLDELQEAHCEGSSKWTKTFRLSGKAKGASLKISFSFSLVGGSSPESAPPERRIPEILDSSDGRPEETGQAGCIAPAGSQVPHYERLGSMEDIKVLHEVLPSSKTEAATSGSKKRELKPENSATNELNAKLEALNADEVTKLRVVAQLGSIVQESFIGRYLDEEEGSAEDKPCIWPQPDKESKENSSDQVELMATKREVKEMSRQQLPESNTETLVCQKERDDKNEATKEEESDCLIESWSPSRSSKQEDPAIDIFPVSSSSGFSPLEQKPLQAEELTKIDAKFSMKNDQLQISSFGSFSFREMKEPKLINKQSMETEELINTDAKSSYTESVKSDQIPISSFGSLSFREMKELELFDYQSMQTEELVNIDAQSSEKRTISSFGSFSFREMKEIEESINADAKSSYSESLKGSPLISDEIRNSVIREFLSSLGLERNPVESSSDYILDSPREQLLKEFEQEFLSTYGDYIIFGIRTETKESNWAGDTLDSIDHSYNVQGVKVELQKEMQDMGSKTGAKMLEDAETEASMSQSGLNEKVLQFSSAQSKDQFGSPIDLPFEEPLKRHLVNNKNSDSQMSSSENYSFTRCRGECVAQHSGKETSLEYVPLNYLAPFAMDKIEALSIEGLRTQAGMPDKEAPLTISPQPTATFSEYRRSQTISPLGLEGTAGLKLLDVKDEEEVIDGPMGLCITLDEWMKLDSSIPNDEDEMNKQTLKILAAHHPNVIALIREVRKGGKRGHKKYGKRWGFMGNNFTAALMVQLRDPLRDFEPVGTPMLALVQVERVFVTLKPKLYSYISEKGISEQEDATKYESKRIVAEEAKYEEEEVIRQFKINEVHVAGLKTEPSKRNVWGNPRHKQSGSKWLLAAGMGKSYKHPLMKLKAVEKSLQVTATMQQGNTLGSISSRIHGTGAKWKELAALNPHIVNPNIIFPNQTIRLQ